MLVEHCGWNWRKQRNVGLGLTALAGKVDDREATFGEKA